MSAPEPLPEPLLAAEGLAIHSASAIIVRDASLAVRPAEVLAITGPNGAGKSLLLRALAGLMPDGVRVEGGVHRPPGRVVLLPQGGPLTPHQTLGAQFAEVTGTPAEGRAVLWLERLHVSQAARRLHLYPHQLSEGVRWRAALALALAAEPRVLLADAPAAGLDPTVRARLLALLADWARETGAALILAGHTRDGVAGPADRLLALENGRLAPPPVSAEPVTAGPPPGGAPVLSVRDLRVTFPLGGGLFGGRASTLVAVDGVSFDVAAGETVALLGESGSGKSVLARAILRLLPGAGGRVLWLGRDLLAMGEEDVRHLRHALQALFPHPRATFDPRRTIGAQVAEALAALAPEVDEAKRRARVDEALADAGLPAVAADRCPAGLTDGEAARAGFARALAPAPRLLVCDEPLATLDATDREDLLAHLLHHQRADSLSIVFATEDADAACRIGHRVLVLLAGRVVEEAPAGVLTQDARHPYTRALLAAAGGGRPDLAGDPPPALRLPTGCAARLRCPRARDFCAQEAPHLETVRPGHRVACHYWDADAGEWDAGEWDAGE
ncbi:MAG TPA: oligopeptide/dipeptide ABC transporter ATP-binding protein [Azospirillum sp.]|nr:oligopeptide/dipeptide ABC transporter ATP-binding protein [Azospirillum sp.]